MKILKKIVDYFAKKKQKKHHDKIVGRYKEFSTIFGDALSYNYLGTIQFSFETKSFSEEEAFKELDLLEHAYAALGYRIIDISDWISYGGYGKDIDKLWLSKRDPGERPVFTKELIERQKT